MRISDRWSQALSPVFTRTPKGSRSVPERKLLTSATLRGLNGHSYQSVCTRHVFRMSSACICERVAEGLRIKRRRLPEASKRYGRRRRLQIGPRRLPEGLRMTRKGCGRVPEGFPKACGAPRSRPELNLRRPNKKIKSSMPKAFRSRVGPEGFQKGCGRVPAHPEGMSKVLNYQFFAFGDASGTLRDPKWRRGMRASPPTLCRKVILELSALLVITISDRLHHWMQWVQVTWYVWSSALAGALDSQDRDILRHTEIISQHPALLQAGHSAYSGYNTKR